MKKPNNLHGAIGFLPLPFATRLRLWQDVCYQQDMSIIHTTLLSYATSFDVVVKHTYSDEQADTLQLGTGHLSVRDRLESGLSAFWWGLSVGLNALHRVSLPTCLRYRSRQVLPSSGAWLGGGIVEKPKSTVSSLLI